MGQTQFRSDDTNKWLEGFGDGSDGNGSINTSTDAPIDSACSGTVGTKSLTATNASFAPGQIILIHKTRGNTTVTAGSWELNKIVAYSAGTITLKYDLTHSYNSSGANASQVLVMKQYNNLTINSAQTLTAKAWNGTVGGIIAYFVKGTATVAGSINARGNNGSTGGGDAAGGVGAGFAGGMGRQGQRASYYGEGTSGASASSSNGNANGNGGGGAKAKAPSNDGGSGGAGGHASAGGNGATTPGGGQYYGIGGSAAGVAALTTMVFGGGGGGSANGATENSGASGGGAGGGIVLIISSTIIITGSINVRGGTSVTSYRGYSGGAGGSCLIKAKTATLGTNRINGTFQTAGVNASNGRIHLDYKTSYTGTTIPTLDATQDATLGASTSNFFLMF